MTQILPTLHSEASCAELIDKLGSSAMQSAVVTDSDGRYLGLLYRDQVSETNPEAGLESLELSQSMTFDENTSLWSAMESMRDFIGEAVPVVNSGSGQYLGAIPESTVLGSYLDAVHDLRREEHEA